MNVKRLTILRNALIKHAKDQGNLKFDLNDWVGIPERYQKRGIEAVRGALAGRNFCGTTACAMGLAASLPEFNREGLKLRTVKYDATLAYTFIADDHAPDGGDEFSMAERFFGLDRSDACELFSPTCYDEEEHQNPIAVADKITALLMTA
jgi:hypothetical protein